MTSPEQARGRAVDKRTDVWAFGCVLYEMLAAQQAFGGETVSDIIARTLQQEPDWTKLPPNTPPLVHDVRRQEPCVTGDIGTAGDARPACYPRNST